jgi:cardiolipin synthase
MLVRFCFSILMMCLVCSGCASLPEIGNRLDAHWIEGDMGGSSRGIYGPGVVEWIVDLTAGDETVREALKRFLKIEQELLGHPLIYGNRVKLLVDTPATLRAMFHAMENAEDHIHIETYLLSDDSVGRRLSNLLLRKRADGLEIRIIYDGIGSRGSSPEYFEKLRRGGIETIEFHPFTFPAGMNLLRLNVRDHRKLLIVDGNIAFTGGINIADGYARGSFGSVRGKNGTIRNRDTPIEGPAVAEFQAAFLHVWNDKAAESGLRLLRHERGRYFPFLKEKGHELVRAVPVIAGGEGHEVYRAYMAALRNARSRIWITQAYFVPSKEFLAALKQAAQRGVDVRLILPGVSDHPLVQGCSRSHYEFLLESGVRLYERSDAMLHAKTAVIDGVWSTVGSSNLDYRSFLYNHEANAIVIGRRFGARMERLFLRDMRKSREILLEEWKTRPFENRIMETIGFLVERWM